MASNISILITTRNRAAFLSSLLKSISLNTQGADQIIVVSSGHLIDDVAKPYINLPNWEFFHLNEIGQSAQKKFGISKIHSKSEWVIFLDDDVTISDTFIEDVESRLADFELDHVVGVGFKLALNSPMNLGIKSNFLRIILSATRSHGLACRLGIFLPYRFSRDKIQVQWLNGVSMWHKKTLDLYELPFYNSKYAALEDVIFSQNARRVGKLMYEPNLILRDQNPLFSQSPNLMQLKYYTLWKFWTLQNLSRFIFFVAFLIHVIHCIKLIFKRPNSYLISFGVLNKLLIFQVKIFGMYIYNKKSFEQRIIELLRML